MSAVAADFLDHWGEAGFGRWFASFTLVVALHVCAALIFAFHRVELLPPPPPDTPVLLDLAPPEAPPPAAPAPVAPVPASTGSDSTDNAKQQGQIQVPVTPAPSLPAAPQPKLEVAQLPPPQASAPEPAVTEPVAPPPEAPAPAAVEVPRFLVPPPPPVAIAEVAPAAPVPAPATSKPAQQATAGLDVLPQPNARDNPLTAWQKLVIAKLNRLRRTTADRRAGIVDVAFSVDHSGHIVYFEIVSKAPYESLNHAVRSLMRRADPLPPPPPEAFNAVGGPKVYTVTIDFVHVPLDAAQDSANSP